MSIANIETVVRSLILGVFLCLGAIRVCAEAAATGISHCAASYYMGDNPPVIRTLGDLPGMVRKEVETHLRARLGSKFYGQLKFSGGHSRDTSRAEGPVVPGAVFYELNFSFSQPENGISEYVALLALAENGAVLAEIDLPAFGGASAGHPIVPLDAAKKLAAKAGFSGPGVETDLDYSRDRDCLLWRFRRSAGSEGGKILFRDLEVLMLDHPVVEIRNAYAIP